MRRSYGLRTFRILELSLYHSLAKPPVPDLTHEFFRRILYMMGQFGDARLGRRNREALIEFGAKLAMADSAPQG